MIKNIMITYKNKGLTAPYGTRVYDVIDEFKELEQIDDIVAAKVNNKTVSLNYKLRVDSNIDFLTPRNGFGYRVYINSLTFVLHYVFNRLYSKRKLVISHSLADGMYFSLTDNEVIPDDMVLNLENEMKKVVEEKLGIHVSLLDKDEAMVQFENDIDRYEMLKYSSLKTVRVTSIKDYSDISITPVVINTGMLKYFKIQPYREGLIIRYPKKRNFPNFIEFEDQKKLFYVYKEQEDWGRILGYDNIGNLNDKIANNKMQDAILITEALQSKKIVNIANEIKSKKDVKIVLIAGPSSSGKTTFAKKLSIYLKSENLNAYSISMDNYFKNREDTPIDEDGEYDFEALEALDVECFNNNLNEILDGTQTQLPIFNFKTGTRDEKHIPYEPKKDEIIIIEGIHGLNPKLVYDIDPKFLFKIYISPLTQVNISDSVRVPTTTARLFRRLVRDYRYRGVCAEDTLKRWPSVRRGESKNIFPYQNNADVYFNSAFPYELSVLRVYAEPLLKSVSKNSEHYQMANYLIDFILHFLPIASHYIPDISILREFIGHSIYWGE